MRQPAIHKALADLMFAARKLVACPDEDDLFWHPMRETQGAAERRFDKLRKDLAA